MEYKLYQKALHLTSLGETYEMSMCCNSGGPHVYSLYSWYRITDPSSSHVRLYSCFRISTQTRYFDSCSFTESAISIGPIVAIPESTPGKRMVRVPKAISGKVG